MPLNPVDKSFPQDVALPVWSSRCGWLQAQEIELPTLTLTIMKFGVYAQNSKIEILFILLGKILLINVIFKVNPNLCDWENMPQMFVSLNLATSKSAQQL